LNSGLPWDSWAIFDQKQYHQAQNSSGAQVKFNWGLIPTKSWGTVNAMILGRISFFGTLMLAPNNRMHRYLHFNLNCYPSLNFKLSYVPKRLGKSWRI
jgi:hypothetical protein